MKNNKRMSFITVLVALFQTILSSFFTYFIFTTIFHGTRTHIVVFLAILAIVLQILTFIGTVWYWIGFKYNVDNSYIYIYKGVIKKTQKKIPLSKITQYNQYTPLLYKGIGKTRMIINTGIDSDDGLIELTLISISESNILKKFFQINGIPEKAVTNTRYFFDKNSYNSEKVALIFSTNTKDIFISSISSLQILSIVALFDTLRNNLNSEWLTTWLRALFTKLLTKPVFFSVLISFIIATLIILGFIKQYINFGNFELLADQKNFYEHTGILNKSINSFKKDKITTLYVKSSILMRIFGLVKVDMHTSSPRNVDNDSKNVLLPFIPREKFKSLLYKELSLFHYTNVYPSKNNYGKILIFILGLFTSLTILALITAKFMWLLSLIIIICSIDFLIVQFIHLYCTNVVKKKESIITTSGLFTKKEYITNKTNIERVRLRQGPIQKILHTYTMILYYRAAPIKKRKIYFLSHDNLEIVDFISN